MLQNVTVIHIGILIGRRMIEANDDFRPVVVIYHNPLVSQETLVLLP